MRRNYRGSKLLAALLVLVMLLCSFPMVYAEDTATEIAAVEQEYTPEIEPESVMAEAEPAAESELVEAPEEEPAAEAEPVEIQEEEPAIEPKLVEITEEEPTVEPELVEVPEEEPAIEAEPVEILKEEPAVEPEFAEVQEEEAAAEPETVEIPEEEPAAEPETVEVQEEEPAAETEPVAALEEEPVTESEPVVIPEETPEETETETVAETEAEAGIEEESVVEPEAESEEDADEEASEDTLYVFDDDEVGSVSDELLEIFNNPDTYEKVEFTGSVDIVLKNSEICYDRDVTLVARVSGADMDYRLVWEANDGSGWFAVAAGEEYTFLLTPDIVSREYRVILYRVC